VKEEIHYGFVLFVFKNTCVSWKTNQTATLQKKNQKYKIASSVPPKYAEHCTQTDTVKHFLQVFPELNQFCQHIGNIFF